MANQLNAVTLLLQRARQQGREPEVREFWTERAAIREYVGGSKRPIAEQDAWGDTLEFFKQRLMP